jgi:aldehyde dehydrogenase (NAD+)
MITKDKFYIGGQWVAPAGSGAIDVHSPTDGALLARIPQGTAADAEAAIAAARKAFDAWAATPPARRAELLKKIQEGLKARTDEIARTISLEMGMPYKLSQRIQVGSPTATFGMYSRMLGDFAFEEQVGNSKVLREPVGVVVAITPWNYPLHQIAAKVAAALAAGCTVVLKPSEVAPLNAFALAEIIHEAGVPPGVFNLVTGYGPEIGEALVTHPQVDMVSFTGSTGAGKRISQLAADTRQACGAGTRRQVGRHRARRRRLQRRGQGRGRQLLPQCRPDLHRANAPAGAGLALRRSRRNRRRRGARRVQGRRSAAARDHARAAGLEDAAGARARLHRQGHCRWRRIAGRRHPTCRRTCRPAATTCSRRCSAASMPNAVIAQEEIFGPVLSIITYTDEDDAVRIANDSIYGLSGGVWSATDARAEAVARRLRTGQVEINGGPFNIYAPFGGYKQSGNGRELGKYGLEDFLELKAMQFKPPPKAT